VTGILAHGFGGTNGLPLPRWLLGYTLAFTVVIALITLRILRNKPRHRVDPRPTPERHHRPQFVATRVIGLAAFVFVFAAAAFGVDDSGANIAILSVIVVFWLGGQVAALVLGDWYWWFNPMDTIAALVVRRDREGADAPADVTAAVFLFSFLWFVFAYPEFYPPAPHELAWYLAAYTVAVVAGATVWGRSWVRDGEGFGALFAAIGGLAPWRRSRGHAPMALVVVWLGGIGFDGLSQTTWWIQVLGTSRGWSERALNTVGLVWTTACVGAVFLGATALAARFVDRPREDVADRFAPVLVPLGIAWSIAHYLTAFLLDFQVFVALLSDPFGRGWDLFGTVANPVNQRLLTTTQTGIVQSVVVFAGCVTAVLLTHDIAFTSYRGRGAVRATYPIAAAVALAGTGAIALLLGT
jgi:hypothetical protein